MKKSDIRKKILKIRKLNNNKYLDISFEDILKIIEKYEIKSRIIGGYYSYNHEVDLMKVLEKFEKNNYEISLPKVKNNSQMNFFHWSVKDPLGINRYGIPEPTSHKIKYPSIMLVPLIAFDKYFNRIGYGGGFYDRYIKKIRKIKKVITIGFAYSFQKVNKIPIKEYDVTLDFIITEKK